METHLKPTSIWSQQVAAFRQIFVNLLIPGASTEQQRWFAELEQRTVSPQTAVRLWRAFPRIDIGDLTSQVRVPTLDFHVWGDFMVPFEAGLALATLIPNARFVPLTSDNHILQKDDPAWPHFLAEMRSFLRTSAPEPETAKSHQIFPELTPREREVLELVAQGIGNTEIAERLVITPKTVRNHVTCSFPG